MKGLTEEEVYKSKLRYGSNQISKLEKESFIKILIRTLGDPIIKILLIALAIKTLFLFQNFDWYETVGIVIAIFIASFISTMSEYGSEKAFQKLEEDASKIKSKVIRNKIVKEIEINDIVVGDLIKIETGDQIPADGKIIKGSVIVNESNLNGEMKEKEKKENDKVYRSTVVYSGLAFMKAQKIGDETIYGQIAAEVKEKTQTSPLKLRLTKLAKQISIIGYLGAGLVFLSYMFSTTIIKNNFNPYIISKMITNFPLMLGHILHALTLSVTIIVVAVPEGLPMMITLVLSSNMRRMIKNNVLVRKLTGIETAGNINILFTDKTGTITKGNLSVTKIVNSEGKEYKTEEELKQNYEYYKIVYNSLTANNESVYDDYKKPIGGNITDRAILSFFSDKSNEYKIIDRIPFSSKKKYSVVKVKKNNNDISLIKGAPEKLIDKCNYCYKKNKIMIFTNKIKIKEIVKEAGAKGIRVLAFISKIDNKLIFEGLIFIKDEIRKEAIEGLKKINLAKVQTIMITGDNKETAKSIGKEVGLINDKSLVITSEELNKMTDEEIKSKLKNIKIIARALPQDKSRLVKIAQESNYVVGMTGDGVNDAPALKKADVGFSMGSGTEVAKEASDIVILDDNLLSISNAILYGRTIFKSIRKFIIFQLTMNICAVSVSIIGPFIGIETPVTVVQMLWINMVMDTLAALAFSYEPPLKEYMLEKPKDKNEQIINKYMKGEIIFTGTFSAVMCIVFLKFPLIHSIFRDSKSDKYLLTAFFGLFIFMGIFNSFNARTNRLNLCSHLIENKVFLAVIIFILIIQIYLIYYGGNIFRTYGLNLVEFETMIILSMTVIPIDFLRKLYLRKQGIIGGV
ncbi:MAG: calcium-translocating P-type ATPase, PMCA-type [Bacilli bacterium]|nr:calcium-translocating P-type ATPase, PMCA-type [Bacilli bacterium]MBR3208976.1 calcium-translocating P-type ATPase, PMCA-type [Bacilli bacterium]